MGKFEEIQNKLVDILDKLDNLSLEDLINDPSLEKLSISTFGTILIKTFQISKEIKNILQSIEDEREAVFLALFWASQKTLLETFREIGLEDKFVEGLNEEDKEILIRPLKEYKEKLKSVLKENKLEETLIENLEHFNIFDFYSNVIVKFFEEIIFSTFENDKEFLDLLNKLKEDGKIKFAGLERLKGKFRTRFERYFWFFVEKEDYKNKFNKILSQINSQENLKKLEEYLIEKYYRKILKRFEDEPIFDDPRGVSLKDVYVEQFYKVYKDNRKNEDYFFYKKKLFSEPKKKETIVQLIKNILENKENELITPDNPKIVLVLGQPGEGKSSLTKKLIYDFIENKIDTNQVYLLELRRLEEKDLSNFSIETLENELKTLIFGKKKDRFDLPNFENSTIILDGLDEILMQEKLLTDEAERFIANLLWNIKNKDEYKNIRFIITSREGYIDLNKLYPKNKKDILTLKLKEFTKEQQIKWLEKYTQFYPEKKDYIKKFKKSELKEHIEELVSQPVLLYMIVSFDISLDELVSNRRKSYIYNKLFDYIVERKWSETREHPNLKALDKEFLRSILREIAFAIFKSKNEYIHSYDIYKLEGFNEYLNRFSATSNKEKIRDLFKGLLIAFYLREVETEKEDERYLKEEGFPVFAVEFFHKSLQEYLTAEYIFDKFMEIGAKYKGKFIKSEDEVLNIIWDLFSHKKLTKEIRDYLDEIIEENRKEFKDERDNIFTRIPTIYEKLFEKSFIVKTDNIQQEDGIYKPLFTFGNLWIVLKSIFKDISLLENIDKEKFVEFLRLTQSNWISFIDKFLLMNEILEKTDLYRINLIEANLQGANLNKSILIEANLSGVNLNNANLNEVNLRGANLIKANLSNTTLTRANLNNTYLSYANLRNANLKGARLIKADLIEANLTETNLRNANLNNANLKGVNLMKAKLNGASLRGTDFSNTNLNKVFIYIDKENKKYLWKKWGFKFNKKENFNKKS